MISSKVAKIEPFRIITILIEGSRLLYGEIPNKNGKVHTAKLIMSAVAKAMQCLPLILQYSIIGILILPGCK